MLVHRSARLSTLFLTVASVLAGDGLPAAGFMQAADHSATAEVAIASHLQFGEFSKALEIAERLPQRLANEQYRLIAAAQRRSGADTAAATTIFEINEIVNLRSPSRNLVLGAEKYQKCL